MAKHQYTKDKYLTDLKEWGVAVPPDLKYEDIRSLWDETNEEREARVAGKAPDDIPHVSGGAVSMEMLEKAVEDYLAKRNLAAQASSSSTGSLTKDDLKEVLQAVKDGPTNAVGQLRAERIAPHDRIAPVTFFSPYPRYYITEKWAGDYAEALPLGMGDLLKFRQEFSYSVMSGDVRQKRFLSTLVVSSRTLYKWLTGEDLDGTKVGEPHEMFNRAFFRNANRAIERSDTSLRAQIFDKHVFGLSSLRFDQLVQRAQDLGLPANVDWTNVQYRSAIADKLTDGELAAMNARSQNMMREQAAEKLLMNQEGLAVANPA